MPPWLPRHGVVTYAGERHLSELEIRTVEQWVQQGMPEGNPADLPKPPIWHKGWQIGQPDVVLEMTDAYQLPASGGDRYRNFVLPTGIEERKYVRGIELWPDIPAVVHHAVVTIDRTRWSRHRDEQDPEPGYDGMLAGHAESPDGHFLAWTPGRMSIPEPDDMAWVLDRGTDLVLQLHLMPVGHPVSVRVKVGLFFTSQPPTRRPVMLRLGPKDLDIAAGEANYVASDEYTLPVDVDALSVYPHAHYLARTMSAFARLPDGSVRPLLEIPRWNFHWQDQYRFATAVALPRGTTLVMRFVYDNSGAGVNRAPRRVVYGPRSSDEMSDVWLQVLPHDDHDREALVRQLSAREARTDIAGYETLLRARPQEAAVRGLLGSLYAAVGRWGDAERAYRTALRDAPADWSIHYNLGVDLQSRGQAEGAEAEYQAAIRLNGGVAEAHHALGLLRYAAGRFADAIEEYRIALRIWPDYVDAQNSLGSALAKSGQRRSAIAAYRTVLALDPDHIPALNNLGILLATEGQVDEAVRLLSHAVSLAPARSDSRQNLAAALALQATRAKRP